ncbi:MAG: ATP-binding cassette domain-containing protein [Desulfoplanes sp.]|nr:ATP-binding cassette domain-containing protein [Desulfoplanes sp.]
MNTGSRRSVEIILDNLDVHMGGAAILQDISWHLGCGEHWAVLGANGAGKSTLLKLVHGLVWPRQDKGERVYLLGGSERITPVDMRRMVSLVSSEIQDMYWKRSWNMPVRTVVETGFFDTPFLYESLSSSQKDRCRSMCERLGIAHLMLRGMLELSTGEAKKVLLARAMVKNPRLLLLDECCLGLDPQSRENFLGLVDDLALRDGVQIVATSHRMEELPGCITHVATLAAGRIGSAGAKEDVAVPAGGSLCLDTGMIEQGTHLVPAMGEGSKESELLRITNATVRIQGTDILHDISWTMTDKQDWAILGPNGAGKSTFLKLITGAVHPLPGGKVDRFLAPDAEDIWGVRSRMGYVSSSLQTGYPLTTTGLDVVLSGFFSSQGLHREPSPEQRACGLALAEVLGLTPLLGRPVRSFSYGQMRKLLIARAMVHRPVLLLLDEPFAGVEQNWRREVRDFLITCRSRGTRLIVVTHHLDQLDALVSHRLLLDKGRIVKRS